MLLRRKRSLRGHLRSELNPRMPRRPWRLRRVLTWNAPTVFRLLEMSIQLRMPMIWRSQGHSNLLVHRSPLESLLAIQTMLIIQELVTLKMQRRLRLARKTLTSDFRASLQLLQTKQMAKMTVMKRKREKKMPMRRTRTPKSKGKWNSEPEWQR
jgi:hypothetical protein